MQIVNVRGGEGGWEAVWTCTLPKLNWSILPEVDPSLSGPCVSGIAAGQNVVHHPRQPRKKAGRQVPG